MYVERIERELGISRARTSPPEPPSFAVLEKSDYGMVSDELPNGETVYLYKGSRLFWDGANGVLHVSHHFDFPPESHELDEDQAREWWKDVPYIVAHGWLRRLG